MYIYIYINGESSSYIPLYSVYKIAKSTLHFTPWQTCSFQHHLNFSEKHSTTLQLLRKDYSSTYPPVYSQVLIYTAE